MKVLSLFSGIGGFDLGFERAGMEVVGMCEIDKHAQKILQRHFPGATLHTDVRKVSYERGAVDIICGGFPCQDLSVAGKRRGLAGDRSGLWYEFARIIDEAEPAWVVIENVPGLFSSNGGHDFAVIVDWLAQRGYGVGWRVLDAQGFGLAQRRKRVFIVASFGSPRGCTVLLEPESLRRDFAKSRQARQGNTRTTENGADENCPHRSVDIARALTAVGRRPEIGNGNFVVEMSDSVQDIAPTLGAEVKQSLMTGDGNIIDREHGGAEGVGIAENAPMYTLTSTDRHGVGVLWEASHGYDPARVSNNQDIVPTLSAKMGTGGNNVPLIGVRRLTPTECERLQGFPDGWTDGQADSNRYKQLGNAVAVPVAEWIGRRIMGAQ